MPLFCVGLLAGIWLNYVKREDGNLKLFSVHIWKCIAKTTSLTIEAENEDDAKEIAWDKVWDNPNAIYWNEKTQDSGASVYEEK